MQIFFHKEINNPDASIGEQCSMFRTVCSHKVIALGFNTLCYDAERRGIKPSARINGIDTSVKVHRGTRGGTAVRVILNDQECIIFDR